MGYQQKKEQVEGRLRRIKRICFCAVAIIVLALCVLTAFYPPNTWKYYVKLPKIGKRAEGELRIHFLDVGQGDSTIVELPDGKIMLIDGGDGTEATAFTILRHLNALKVKQIDYLVVTHPDSDHCGALDLVLEHKEVRNAYVPTVTLEGAGTEFAQFYMALLEEPNCSKQYASRSVSLSSADWLYPYTLQFLYPYTLDATDDKAESNVDTENNALSSVLWLDYKGVSTLFTGDAPTETEELLVWADEHDLLSVYGVNLASTEILKVAHHGSKDSTSLAFLQYLHAKTAVISCGANNMYGHPASEVLQNLQTANISTYRTDEFGTVIVTIGADGGYGIAVKA